MIYYDLKLFAVKHIINPYYNKMEPYICGCSYSCKCNGHRDMTLEEIVDYIKNHKDTEWWELVKNRINKIGITFPNYIRHELVDLVK